MPRSIVLTLLCLACVLAVFRPAKAESAPANLNSEIARIRHHLHYVETALRQRPTTHLTRPQQLARTRALDNLRTYWQAGQFPRNEHFPGQRLPYFRDAHGTPCAMAYLIEKAGGSALVARVAKTNNNAYVRELAPDPELQRWLRTNGMTAAEAAWVQPTYDYYGNYKRSDADDELWGKTLAATAFSGISIYSNLNTPRSRSEARTRGWVGVAVGAVTLSFGLSTLDDSGTRRSLGWYNTGLGIVTAGFGFKTLLFGDRGDSTRTAKGQPLARRWEISSLTVPNAARVQAAFRF